MGRKNFINDLATAQILEFENISKLDSAEDGELTFAFSAGNVKGARITAMIPDVSEYPKSHDYMLFASDDAPQSIAMAVENAPSLRRKSIPQILDVLSKHLKTALSSKSHQSKYDPDEGDDVSMDEDEFDMDDEVMNEDWAMDDDFGETEIASPHPSRRNFSGEVRGQPSDRIRNDLLSAKGAGFKVGALGYLEAGNSCYISISCRIQKLGISEEAMQAWSLEPSHYLCLLLYYPSGYQSLQELTSVDRFQARQDLEIKTGVCDTYKPPSLEEAKHFFKPEITKKGHSLSEDRGQLKDTFISQPLNDLLNERLLTIINLRLCEDLSWWGAERYYNELMGKQLKSKSSRPNKIYREADPVQAAYPSRIVEDELVSDKKTSQLSFPLVAMQFMLRHFVRCTEFCLVCHTKINSQVEAIKPYVCEKPLCLFQYMNLGFGPSIEHEIRSQPFVVDILISFCYASIVSNKIRSYPKGLGWIVPHPRAPTLGRRDDIPQTAGVPPRAPFGQPNQTPSQAQPSSSLGAPRLFKARLNRQEMQLLFDKMSGCPVKKGDWIVINVNDPEPFSWHVRVEEVMFPTVSLSKSEPLSFVSQPANKNKENTKPAKASGKWHPIEFHVYEVNFDDLNNADKAKSMTLLMDFMPSVREMAEYLTRGHASSMAAWNTRLTPASLGLLRWIIASNRSCIMQADDEIPQISDRETLMLGVKKGEQRIGGIGSWLQFRFAMGAPDKEQRFINSLANGNATYPSLFAWHGSPLYNWHGIVREGLNFDEVQHGRAAGNGCYHAPDFTTSMGYSGGYMGYGTQSPLAWPSSSLKISSAIALSEIVNAPEQFTCQKPHYVVQHVDWIQTRYLFVQPSGKVKVADDVKMGIENTLPQDPMRVPNGPTGPIALPLSAIPKARRPRNPLQTSSQNKSPTKIDKLSKSKKSKFAVTADNLASLARGDKSKAKGTQEDPIDLDTASVSTLDEDRELLSEPRPARLPPTPPPVPQTPVTPFKPGSIANLPVLPPPTYATPKASKTLQKAFLELLNTQETHIKKGKLFELGWYLNEKHLETTDNIYQWVVQMHSFPLDIPLAQDMMSAGIDSIVFEIRFSANYPFSPPFVRVVRPRFLPFQMGGGGHVTMGGSVCMDLLTSSGWTAVASIESVLLQIRMALMSIDPRPARLQLLSGAGSRPSFGAMGMPGFSSAGSRRGGNSAGGSAGASDYGVGEAVDAFVRACRVHGWQVPPDLQSMMGTSGYGYS